MRRNDGKFAEGWYDPQTLEKAIASNTASSDGNPRTASGICSERNMAQTGPSSVKGHSKTAQDEEEDDGDDDDEFSPTSPQSERDLFHVAPSNRPGPSIPNLWDLQQARKLAAEEALASRKQVSKDFRADRKAEQVVRKFDLDEVAPLSEPGTHEGQLEKRRELTASNHAFASAKTDPADFELPEADVMVREEIERWKERSH
jgi:hypothetical protein